jgi:benzoate-CoA ligase family protein
MPAPLSMNAADAVLDPARVRADPARTAILFHDERVSYAELLARVNRYGNGLAARGVERENRVLLMLQDSPDFVSAWLGAIKIGAVSVAVNVRSTAEDLLFFLNDSRAKVLLIHRDFLPLYESVAARVLLPLQVFVAGGGSGVPTLGDLTQGRSDALEAAAMSPDDMAFWMYTSGTTGTAKAAVHRHHSVLSCLDFTRDVLGATAEDVLFSSSKLFFAYASSNCLMASFTLGATTVLTDEWPDSVTLAGIFERHRPTLFFSVPTVYRNLLRDGFATAERFASLRRCVCAGERLPGQLLDRWQSATGKELIDALGTTETIFMILANRPGEIRRGASGKPTPRARVELREPDGQVISEPGKPGVLWVRMDSVADRYWNQRARSIAAFVGPWFRTGDVYIADADGYYFQEGRADDMLKISGQWVSPAEIEDEVLKLPMVADAAVVGAANADGLTRLALFIVPAGSASRPEDLAQRIHDELRNRLSVYKCPRDIRVVDELPRTATGKIQRYKLRQEAETR